MGTTPRGPRRRETKALLRAHLAAATRYRHVTRHCPVCHRLLRLAMEHTAEEPEDEHPDGHADGHSTGHPEGRAERHTERPREPRRVSASN
ncbi:hypothetical protein AN219_18885 [Streptomyces nanshensis]|nr:hypothetical protein AN219_18885 [Streptomyces nanshensis]